jgi:hypothetical protein
MTALEAIIGLFREQAIEQVLQRGQFVRQRRQRFGDVHDADRERILGAVRRVADEHFVQHDAETVEIGAAVDRAAARLFGTHVVRRADDRAGAGHAQRGFVRARDAEIGEDGRAVFAQQDVVGLDVAVDDAFFLRIGKRRGDLARDAQRQRGRERRAVAGQHLAAADVFHRDVMQVAGVADVMDAHDVAVMQLGGDARFAQEAFAEVRIDEQRRRHHLERDFAVDRFLDRQIDRRHAAAAELAQHAITGNLDHVSGPAQGFPRVCEPRTERRRSIACGHAAAVRT